MSDSPEKLRKIIDAMPRRSVYLPDEKDLNDVYLESGVEGIQTLLENGELTEVEQVERVPLAVPNKGFVIFDNNMQLIYENKDVLNLLKCT